MSAYGSYHLVLTCDGEHVLASVDTFVGRTASVARGNARKAGWVIDDKQNRVLCPQCRVREALKVVE